MTLTTPRLTLVLQTPEELLTWIDTLGPDHRAQISPDWLARLKSLSAPDPWTCGFRIVLNADGETIGQCAYKNPPDADGMVEIAYGIIPDERGRGYATEAAQALTDHAFANAAIRVVRAHTMPEPNASTRVLTKCGFARVGEVVDPEDGPVWRWERKNLA